MEKENYLNSEGRHWDIFSPAPQVKPDFNRSDEGEDFWLEIEGNGDARIFGGWETSLCLEKECWYEAHAEARTENLEQPQLSLLAVAAGHFLEFEDLGEGRIRFWQCFYYTGTELYRKQFLLLLRAAKQGKVRWERAVVRKIEVPPKRKARIAAIRFEEVEDEKNQTLEKLRGRIRNYLEEAGKAGPDLVLLTEFAPIAGVNIDTIDRYEKILKEPEGNADNFYRRAAEEVPGGPTCRILPIMSSPKSLIFQAFL